MCEFVGGGSGDDNGWKSVGGGDEVCERGGGGVGGRGGMNVYVHKMRVSNQQNSNVFGLNKLTYWKIAKKYQNIVFVMEEH